MEKRVNEESQGKLNKYFIAFKDLPFSPDEKQVIYVENAFNEKINAFIKGNYYRLVTAFKKKNYEFVYLPLYFNAEIEEKIRYYAPYITECETLQSSYLLDYMVRPENRTRITPSLLFYPKRESDQLIFSGIFIDESNAEVSDIVERVETLIYLRQTAIANQIIETVNTIADELNTHIEIVDETSSIPNVSEYNAPYATNSDETATLQENIDDYTGVRFRVAKDNESDDILFRDGDDEDESEKNELDYEAAEELAEIYINLQNTIKLLRLKGIALGAIHRFIDKQEPLSSLVITDDLRLFLPLYNNIEIVMSAQIKALYFLFLNHPEGIVLQYLGDYHSELMNYYRQTNKGVLTPRMEESLIKLETYGNNQLNVLIARIREAFCLKFDEHLARNYFITGEKGQPYKISLDRGLIRWEE